MSMDFPTVILLFSVFILTIYLPVIRSKRASKRVPPGSFGIPFIGHTLNLSRAMRNNATEAWLQERVRKYGPVSKMSILGKPTVFLHGPAANKFIYTCGENILTNQKPYSKRKLFGSKMIGLLSGEDHKHMRAVVVSFLRPDLLKHYVAKMEEEIKNHFNNHWNGKHKIRVMPLMQKLTFNVMTSVIFEIEDETRKRELVEPFQRLIAGTQSIPINFPFTRFNRSLKARLQIETAVLELIKERREKLEQQTNSPQQDFITTLLTLKNDDNLSHVLTDEGIADNVIGLMIAGHDTTSTLLSLMINILANEPSVYANVVREQEEILKSKRMEELLTWDDISRMKYTWRVASEILRMSSPVPFTFRTAAQDFEYGSYIIPKGWQVMWSPFMTHMDESIFSNPNKFDPNRFKEQGVAYSYIPFGGGPHLCPGIEFTRIETLLAIHHLVTRFTWKLSSPHISFFRDPAINFKDGLEIQIKQRSVS